MPRSVKVEIDSLGHIYPDKSELTPLPPGRAILTWPEVSETLAMSESALAKDWLRPEEDAAWAHLQPVG